jgi:pimeloyl-ACP methyl ester carboxylesterase
VVKNTNVVEAERELFYRAMQKFTRRSLPVMSGMGKILDKTPRTFSQPLLIVTGEHDLPIILSNARDWQKRELNAQLQIIPKAGHCANMDNPEEFNGALRDFLEGQG